MNTLDSNMLSAYLSIANTIVSILGLIILIVTLLLTARSIRRTVEESSYSVWRHVYDRMADTPEGASFFGLDVKKETVIDMHMLSIFLTILDMYANRFSDNYAKMSSDTLLVNIMKSPVSVKYWGLVKHHFFSDPKFIAEIDKLVQST